MKVNKTFGIILLIAVVLGISYLIYSSNKKGKTIAAAINSGIPPDIATAAANSANSSRAFMALGVPEESAILLSVGIPVGKENYQCKDSKTGAVYDGPCTQVDANNGWVTSSK